MTQEPKTRLAVGAVVFSGTAVLLVHKVKAMDAHGGPSKIPGEWDFPKGGVIEGEDIIDALHRELMEETGLTGLNLVKELPSFDFSFNEKFRKRLGFDRQHTRMFLMRHTGDSDNIIHLCDEIDQVKFFEIESAIETLHHESCKEYFIQHVQTELTKQ